MRTRSWAKGATPLLSTLLFLLFASTSAQAGEFTVVLSKTNSLVNTPNIVSGAGDWIFVITAIQGKVSDVAFNIKNNAGPGDICWHGQKRNPKSGTTLVADEIPAADFNACGNEQNGGFDPDFGLNVQSKVSGNANATVTITVMYPDP
jgi:hypothetical protein